MNLLPSEFGNGFTPDAKLKSVETTVKSLCYTKFNSSSLRFSIDPKKFICAQIPGIKCDETFVVDILDANQTSSIIVLDFIVYERKFLSGILLLKSTILPQISEGKFSKLEKVLSGPLNLLYERHCRFLNQLECLAKLFSPSFFETFVDYLTNSADILQRHREFMNKYLQVESLALSLSVEYSESHEEQLQGRALIQILRSPIQWQSYASKTARNISTALPNNFPSTLLSSLASFAIEIDKLSESIDAIPKLEKISKLFVTEPFPIVVTGRRILKTGTALKHCRKSIAKRDIFLFSDIFIYAQLNCGRYMAPADYSLKQMRVAICEGTEIFCLSIFAPKKSFVLQFASEAERDEWLEAFDSAISNAKEGYEIEAFKEAPIWIPDNATKCCMCCHQLFTTFTRRRHHCRGCGLVMCSDCLKWKVIIQGISETHPEKVCEQCYQKFIQGNFTSLSSYGTSTDSSEV